MFFFLRHSLSLCDMHPVAGRFHSFDSGRQSRDFSSLKMCKPQKPVPSYNAVVVVHVDFVFKKERKTTKKKNISSSASPSMGSIIILRWCDRLCYVSTHRTISIRFGYMRLRLCVCRVSSQTSFHHFRFYCVTFFVFSTTIFLWLGTRLLLYMLLLLVECSFTHFYQSRNHWNGNLLSVTIRAIDTPTAQYVCRNSMNCTGRRECVVCVFIGSCMRINVRVWVWHILHIDVSMSIHFYDKTFQFIPFKCFNFPSCQCQLVAIKYVFVDCHAISSRFAFSLFGVLFASSVCDVSKQ